MTKEHIAMTIFPQEKIAMSINDGIGSRIREARRLAGLTQGEFGKLAGVSQSYLSEVERDLAKPSIEILTGLSKHCPGLNLHWLLTGEGFKQERVEYIGGDMTRRVTILDAIFRYMRERRRSLISDSTTTIIHNDALEFYEIAARCMADLEGAYDRGETDADKLLRRLPYLFEESRSRREGAQ